MRNNRYRTLCNQEMEYKMQLRVIQENRETRLRELEKQKEIDRARMEHEKEEARLKFEREERERENEHRRAVQRAETAAGIFFTALILIVLLIKYLVK